MNVPIVANVVDRSLVNPAQAETLRVAPPEDAETLEDLFVWLRETFRPGAIEGRVVVTELRGKALEAAIYALPPLRLVTPFGTVVLMEEPDARD